MPITYLTGPAGTGKTTRAVERLRQLLTGHVPASNILVLAPQLTLAQPYRDLLRDPLLPGAGAVEISTLNGLALKTIDLFWPLGATSAGFGRPHARPIFLNIEQAQYYLWQAIAPLLRQGYFDPNVVPLTISLPRLMSQILDNLNKAALIGLPHTEVGGRLAASLTLEPSSRVALEHTQACVNRFREFCLERNLLDFSLRIESFYEHLWPVAGVKQYLTGRYRHLIVDNIEEDTPFAHSVLAEWLPHTESALLVNDEQAGFRIFLGANWRTARQLAGAADETNRLTGSRVASPDMLALGQGLAQILLDRMPRSRIGELTNDEGQKSKVESRKSKDNGQLAKDNLEPGTPNSEAETPITNHQLPFTFEQTRFYPQMLDWVIGQIAALIEAGVSPDQIVVLAPFVSDALRFSFVHRMEQRGLPARSHRPSRPLSEEPAAKAMLTLARLAFPHWGLLPQSFDVAQTLSQAIAGLDLIRADLLAQVVYRPLTAGRRPVEQAPISNYQLPITGFDQIDGPIRERISYEVGVRFDRLRDWLAQVQVDSPPVLDHFFSRLFGEVLSQPGFGFHNNREAGEIVANLVDSARQFRRVAERVPTALNSGGEPQFPDVDSLNRAYLETIEQGIAAAQYIRSWDVSPGDEASVLITPATTFLMSNRPVDYQFWLDAGSSGWWERIAQPLTHPYILAADWAPGRPWSDEDELFAQHDRLYRLVLGLTRRCRRHIYIANAEFGEQGYEQRGQLLLVLQQLLRRMQRQ